MDEYGWKTISLEEITDKHIGKRETTKREAFENELKPFKTLSAVSAKREATSSFP